MEASEAAPKEAETIAKIIESTGVTDYEPRVVNQLLEFTHRYLHDVFKDASVYSEHANKPDLDLEDVRLAIQSRVNFSFTQPPPREVRVPPMHARAPPFARHPRRAADSPSAGRAGLPWRHVRVFATVPIHISSVPHH